MQKYRNRCLDRLHRKLLTAIDQSCQWLRPKHFRSSKLLSWQDLLAFLQIPPHSWSVFVSLLLALHSTYLYLERKLKHSYLNWRFVCTSFFSFVEHFKVLACL